ncbi:MAG: 5-deoxy-glucuronate isomerase [Sphaerochaetaceae bacterium]
MIVQKEKAFDWGYTAVTSLEGPHSDMLLDFGILRLKAGERISCSLPLERAWMLLKGKVAFSWPEGSSTGERESCIDETPVVLHAPSSVTINIIAEQDCELVVERCRNEQVFPVKFYGKGDVKTEVFGAGVLQETSNRTVRTVFDGESAPYSNMVMGEVINHPGRWSSYPPHDHPHPEIYHYRFFPKQGFGVSLLDENAYVVHDGDTSLIKPNTTHSQGAAPGYAMYYVWMIPHLPNDKWLPTTRYYRKEHTWLLEKGVKVWPEIPATME